MAPSTRAAYSDQELAYHIMRKAFDPFYQVDWIYEENVYSQHPGDLVAAVPSCCGGNSSIWYCFTHTKPKSNTSFTGSRQRRTAGNGSWMATGKFLEIKDDEGGLTMAERRSLEYRINRENSNNKKKGDKTEWLMKEYRVPFYDQQGRKTLSNWALCQIHTTSRTPHQRPKEPALPPVVAVAAKDPGKDDDLHYAINNKSNSTLENDEEDIFSCLDDIVEIPSLSHCEDILRFTYATDGFVARDCHFASTSDHDDANELSSLYHPIPLFSPTGNCSSFESSFLLPKVSSVEETDADSRAGKCLRDSDLEQGPSHKRNRIF